MEITHFSKSELSEESLAALRPGANFYWMVGYKDHGSRQRERQSVIFMRRGGRMSREKFQHELQAVDEVWGEFERDTENAACIE
ncbi:hypothetical protein [Pseudolabrys sp.]|uniref:hypothetical protein n=1 Tax=Pseudolabrys sp. TaxID=1960880 RepID=UPI002DDC989A|nr:hypothetical protein [Pseudolabrys sp.]